MGIATGVAKQLRYKAESAWGVAPGTSGAQLLRRVSSDLSLKKTAFESAELSSHYQRQDYRHGVKSVAGSISGELSAGTWEDFVAAAVRRVYTAVSAITLGTVTIGTVAGGVTWTITRGSGDFLAGGIKKGQVTRITGGTFNAANLNKNLVVLAAAAGALTVMPFNGVALVAEAVTSGTMAVPGKVTYVPGTGQTDSSFAIEHWHSDINQSELFLGCKVNQMDIGLPPAGMSTIGLQFLGKDSSNGTAQYYATPAAETTTGILAAPNGLLVAQGGAVALVTGLNFSLKGNMSAEAVVGSNVYADIAEGRVLVDGQLTALFQDATMRDYFINETEVSLIAALSASPSGTADFLAFTLPRIKFGDASKDDGDKAIIQTLPFVALYNSSGGAAADQEQTTLYVQDSQA